ncbi:MAG: nucleotidyltransferase family protein [Acidobacteriota bacterium]|nr:nucleotidyltransferase family protein [Acidobacteriota bacterium]MDH3785033.1 nucleotidyltransferase family protein [Acidobacteriota bacterium]
MSPDSSTELLLALARERPEAIDAILADSTPDSERFLSLCEQTDIEPWLDHQIRTAGLESRIDTRIMGHLAERRRKTRVDNALLVGVAEQVLKILTSAGVTVLGLKGIDLLHRHYERIDLRTVTDVDLLVPRDQLIIALRALGEHGFTVPDPAGATHYIRSSHHLPLLSPVPHQVDVEIHWNLVQDVRYDLDVDELFERAKPLTIGPYRILHLEDHDFVAHILLHHLSHYFNRQLKWLIDLRPIVRNPGFSWKIVAERLHRWGGSMAAAAAVRHLHQLDPQTVGPETIELFPLPAWRQWLTAPFRSRHPLDWIRRPDRRWLQLYLAAVYLERPSLLPRWLFLRMTRDRRESSNPLDDGRGTIDIPLKIRGKHDGAAR